MVRIKQLNHDYILTVKTRSKYFFFFLPEIKAYVSFKQKSHDELLLALVPGKFWPL